MTQKVLNIFHSKVDEGNINSTTVDAEAKPAHTEDRATKTTYTVTLKDNDSNVADIDSHHKNEKVKAVHSKTKSGMVNDKNIPLLPEVLGKITDHSAVEKTREINSATTSKSEIIFKVNYSSLHKQKIIIYNYNY